MTNVLVVMADDMRFDHLEYMPSVVDRVAARGRSFTQARCNVGLCQPSRVGFLSGQLSRDHGDLEIGFSGSAVQGLDDQVASWLQAAGYRCGMFGKFINGVDAFGGIDPPRGWSTWRESLEATSAERFTIRRERDVVEVVGRYETDYLGDEVETFLRSAPEPWFAYLAPNHAHAPFGPHPDDLHALQGARCREVPSDDDAATPPLIRELPPLTTARWNGVQAHFRGRIRELRSLDRLVARCLDIVEDLGQLDTTVVAFTSDNGVYQGEHRTAGPGAKNGPYDTALRVPLLVAGPGFAAGPDLDVPTYQAQDLTATLVDVAGATPALAAQAGTSLRQILADPAAHAQRVLLHEIANHYLSSGDAVSTGPGHRLGHWKLVRYPSVREGGLRRTYELYDLAADPDELSDLAADDRHRATRDELERTLDQLLA